MKNASFQHMLSFSAEYNHILLDIIFDQKVFKRIFRVLFLIASIQFMIYLKYLLVCELY